jgi:hypothetical protein
MHPRTNFESRYLFERKILVAHARQNNVLVAHLEKEGSHARRGCTRCTYRAHLPLPSPPPSTMRSSRWPPGPPPQMKQQQSPLSRKSPPPPLMLRTSFYSFFPQAHLFPRPLHHGAIAKMAVTATKTKRIHDSGEHAGAGGGSGKRIQSRSFPMLASLLSPRLPSRRLSSLCATSHRR